MIKLNRIHNIFVLTILLSPLFGSCAEEHELLKRKQFDNGLLDEEGQEKGTENLKRRRLAREKISSEWNRILLDVAQSDGSKNCVHFAREKAFCGGTWSNGETKDLGELASNRVRDAYRFDDPAGFEEKIRNCFKQAANCIPIGNRHPRISFFVHSKNENNLHIANTGERIMVIRNGKIIFNSKDSGNLLNPIIHTHSIEEGDMILSLTEGFQESDDAIVKMFSDSDVFLSVGCNKRPAMVMRFMKQAESEQ